MGCRLHYQKKREIDYGSRAAFNWQGERVREMILKSFEGTEHSICETELEVEHAYGSFLLSREGVEHLINFAESRKGISWVDDDDKGDVYTWRYVADYFRAVLNEIPKENDNIYFEWS